MKPLFFEPGRDFPVVLAPMAGVTDPVFRGICRVMGADFSYTEMVSAKGMHYNNANTKELVERGAEEAPYGVQLFGREPQMIAEAVGALCRSNTGELALIDINMGCPAQKIVKNGEGSALMCDEATAARVIEAAAKASDLPVSVKFRKGWDDGHVNAVSFARMAENAGASLIAVHGRTREQLYTGKADREIIAEVKAAVHIPVFGNGDVFTAGDALDMKRETGCDGIMVARGAEGNPFIFREIKAALAGRSPAPPTPLERIETAELHIRGLCALKGARAAVMLRKHVSWYTTGLRDAAELRRNVNMAADAEGMLRLLEIYKSKLA